MESDPIVSSDEHFKKWLEVGVDVSQMTQKSLRELNPLQAFFDQFPGSKPTSDRKEEE